jgi:hypothetical protein
MRSTPTVRLAPSNLSTYPSHIFLKRLARGLLEGSKTRIQGLSGAKLTMEARREANFHIVFTGMGSMRE